MNFSFQASLPVTFFRENKHFVAYTPALDLATSGPSFATVKKRFSEVVEIFIEELVEKGTLEEVLDGLGWTRKTDRTWNPPVVVAQETTSIRIPISH